MTAWILQVAPQGQAQGTMMMMGAMFLVLYFLMIRPQQKQAKEQQSMRNSLKKGDKIITRGGMRGKIESVKEVDGQNIAVVLVDDNVKIEFLLTAIETVVKPLAAPAEKAKDKEKGSLFGKKREKAKE
jgi:preprotein translocase subunit YajC